MVDQFSRKTRVNSVNEMGKKISLFSRESCRSKALARGNRDSYPILQGSTKCFESILFGYVFGSVDP